MKRLLLLGMALMMVVSLAAAQTADFNFVVPTPIIYDVPFDVQLQVNTDGEEFIDYDLSVGSTSGQVTFSSGLRRADPFQFVESLSGPHGGASYRVRTETNGNTMTTSVLTTLFTLTNIKFQGTAPAASFTLLPLPQRSITPATSGRTFTITAPDSISITPQLSSCGDGVIGYIDANNNGIEDLGEKREACDTAVSGGADGCSAACDYINLGWKCTNTDFGSRNSVCTQLTPQQFFLEKTTALINAECYPKAEHPDALYCKEDGTPTLSYDPAGKLSLAEKINLIAQVGTALKNFFTAIVWGTSPSASVLISDVWSEEDIPLETSTSFALYGADSSPGGGDDLGDLTFYIYLKNIPEGDAGASLRLRVPAGAIYNTFHFTVIANSVTLTPNGYRATSVVPVDGTDISRNGLTGRWTAEVIWDTADPPIASQTFELT